MVDEAEFKPAAIVWAAEDGALQFELLELRKLFERMQPMNELTDAQMVAFFTAELLGLLSAFLPPAATRRRR